MHSGLNKVLELHWIIQLGIWDSDPDGIDDAQRNVCSPG